MLAHVQAAQGRSGAMKRFILVVVLALFVCAAQAQDLAREARWRAEVEPTVLVGDTVDLVVSDRKVFAIYTPGTRKDVAVLLVHGVGVHPDHGLIGKLRTQIAEAGISTFSVQMPVLGTDVKSGEEYVVTFPEAARRIDVAAKWLRNKGYTKLVLASHSMGAWMSNVYLQNAVEAPPFIAWVCIGITGKIGGTGKFDGPILDLYGENDLPPVLSGAWLRRIKLALHTGSDRVIVPQANHYFENKEKSASDAIVAFVQRLSK
jgi:dienelactone hydrolase